MQRALLLVPLALSLVTPASAEANGVQVSPVIIQIAPERRLASLRVRNWRESEVSFEIKAYSWRQVNGEDQLSDATDVVVVPSVFAIQPGAEQIVRLAIVANTRGAGRETAYRLVLRQLPVAETEAGLRVQLQMSLPVFAPPLAPRPEIRVRRGVDDQIVVSNAGTSVVRLSTIEFGADGTLAALPRYLLAGAEFARAAPRGLGSVRVTYTSLASPEPRTDIVPIDATAAIDDQP